MQDTERLAAAARIESQPLNLTISLQQPEKKLALFGTADRHLRLVREALGVGLVARDDELRLSGDPEAVSRAAAVLEQSYRG